MNASLTPNLSDIFAYIDDHSQPFVSRLIDYLCRPSSSASGEGIGQVAAYIANVMRQMGLTIQIMPTSGWPMVFGDYHVHDHAPTVLLYGHYDVQPPDPLEAWITPPFEPTIGHGRLYARRVGDNKG